MMKKLIVCGDSFMSPVLSFPKSHFTEIFASELQFDLLIYARSGMSNAGILVQLNHAIEQKPDLVIFNTTSFDRTEVPVQNLQKNSQESYTTENLLYTQSMGLSSHYPWANKDPKIWSISIADLLIHSVYDSRGTFYENHNTMVNLQSIEDYDEKCEVAKKWFTYLYDPTMKRMIDSFMLYGVVHKLHCSEIPYIWVHDGIWLQSLIKTPWLNKKNDVREKIGHYINSGLVTGDKDPGYHTNFETQKTIAKFLVHHYQNNF